MSLIMMYFLRKLSLYELSNHPSLVFFIQSTTVCLFIITLQGERTVSYWAPPGFNLTVKLWKAIPGTLPTQDNYRADGALRPVTVQLRTR